MKRTVLIGAVVLTVVVVAVVTAYGPNLLAAYRFYDALDRHFEDYQADGGSWPQLQDGCALCHGSKGQAKNALYPSLAGLSAPHIEAQLRNFAEGSRANPQMTPLAAALTDEQIKNLAAYYARQTPVRNEDVVADAATEQQGQDMVAAQACAACHGDRLAGGQIAPRLAGQGKVYLIDQLIAFKRGERQDSSRAMNAIAGALSQDEINAIASYVAGLSPVSSPGTE